MHINENNFIRELHRQNEDALRYVLEHYGWILKTVLVRELRHLPDMVDDALNECLFQIWSKIETYDPRRAAFTTWIANIARYKAIDLKRKYVKERSRSLPLEEELLEDATSLVSERLLAEETEAEIQVLLSELSPLNRKLFTQYVLQDKPVEELSREHEMSPASIYNRISRSKSKLRKRWGKQEQKSKLNEGV